MSSKEPFVMSQGAPVDKLTSTVWGFRLPASSSLQSIRFS